MCVSGKLFLYVMSTCNQQVRTLTYRNSMWHNKHLFKGKVGASTCATYTS